MTEERKEEKRQRYDRDVTDGIGGNGEREKEEKEKERKRERGFAHDFVFLSHHRLCYKTL